MAGRVRLVFLPGVEGAFADRDAALGEVVRWGEAGTRLVEVVYGPEGCGKTALLRQASLMLREMGYEVIYVDPLHGILDVGGDLRRAIRGAVEALGGSVARLAFAALELLEAALRLGVGRVAILVDEAFQAIGVDRVAAYVKRLLGLIEYPPRRYERIVAVVASSEGVTRAEVGRHRWAEARILWNMPREGFEKLYEQLPGPKPEFEEAWRLTGGNPGVLAALASRGWRREAVVDQLLSSGRLDPRTVRRWRGWLERLLDDPDVVVDPEFPEQLLERLIRGNLIVYPLPPRGSATWLDRAPPERDPELGIGRYTAWQTPLHREAVKRLLESVA